MNLETVDHLLTSTRSVRKRLDLERPVPMELIQECLELAIQAPTGSNRQGWRFLVVTDPDKRATLASSYQKAFQLYADDRTKEAPLAAEDPRGQRMTRVLDSATYLAQHLARVPVHILACIEGRVEDQSAVAQASVYGSILPAVWSLMLALRSRGLGSAWTTLHLMFEKEVAQLLGIPETYTQAALLPVAYFKGKDFKPAVRIPAREITYWNQWGELG